MAFPVVEEAVEGSTNTAGTSHTIAHPSVVQAGELWILILDKGSTSATVNAHALWTELLDEALANGLYIAYRWTDGTEGTSSTLTTSASTRDAHILYRISGAQNPSIQAPQIGTTATGTSATPDPPASAAPSATMDHLFIAFAGMAGEEADDDTWGNTPPTNYTPSPPRQKSCGVAGTNLGGLIVAAERQLNTGSADNPGTFGVDVSAAWRAQTILVHPAPSAATTDAVARFFLSARNTVDAGSRFRIGIGATKDSTSRFKVQTATAATKDGTSRFVLSVANTKDATARAVVSARDYRDATSRFMLSAAATRLYLRDIANSIGISSLTLLTAKGTVQTTRTIGSVADSAHHDQMIARFATPPLAVTAIDANTWEIGVAVSEEDVKANSYLYPVVYVYRIGSGVVGYVYNTDAGLGAEWATTEDGIVTTFSGSAVASVDPNGSDVLVVEVWRHTPGQDV